MLWENTKKYTKPSSSAYGAKTCKEEASGCLLGPGGWKALWNLSRVLKRMKTRTDVEEEGNIPLIIKESNLAFIKKDFIKKKKKRLAKQHWENRALAQAVQRNKWYPGRGEHSDYALQARDGFSENTYCEQKVTQREPEATWKGWQGGISETAKHEVIHLRWGTNPVTADCGFYIDQKRSTYGLLGNLPAKLLLFLDVFNIIFNLFLICAALLEKGVMVTTRSGLYFL